MSEHYKDTMIRALAGNEVMAFFVTSKMACEAARLAHHSSPVVTAALGRLLSAALMMGDMLKNEEDKITLQIESDGPLKGLLVTADTFGNVKGYPNVEQVILPLKEDGHLDVGGAVGNGSLSVMKDMGFDNPYHGHVPLVTGEIGEDITHYFSTSEQTPSSVGLGVLVDTDYSVKCAGGFILQLLPNASDESISRLEENLASFGSVTNRLLEENDPHYLASLLLKGFDVELTKEKPVRFYCDCSKDRVKRALALLGEPELYSMIKDNQPVELKCQFCNSAYSFTIDEIKEIYKSVRKS